MQQRRRDADGFRAGVDEGIDQRKEKRAMWPITF
jgi:hypothetical protein